MGDLAAILPWFPYDVLNIILSYSEDGLIRARYSRGRMVYRIHWDSDSVCDLEALLLMRRIFPEYCYYYCHPDEKHVYCFIKDYFKAEIRERGMWMF
jgi:hypothetical protein